MRTIPDNVRNQCSNFKDLREDGYVQTYDFGRILLLLHTKKQNIRGSISAFMGNNTKKIKHIIFSKISHKFVINIFIIIFFIIYFIEISFAKSEFFSSGDSTFTLDIPNDWKTESIKGGCLISSPNKNSSISIQRHPTFDRTADQIFHELIYKLKNKKANIINVTSEKLNQFTVYTIINSVKVSITINVSEGYYACIIMSGDDTEKLKKIINSIGLK